MHKLKNTALAALLTAGVCLFSGCGQVDEGLLESNTDFSVNIAVPFATNTPLPEYMNVPDQVVIDANGAVTVNDASLLANNNSSARQAEAQYITLSIGNTSPEVQNLQQRLQALGYFTGGVSGVFDEQTETAVKRFEQTYGIMQTGIATPAFQVKLFEDTAPIYGSEAYDTAVVSQYSTLQRGAVGSAVYALQHRLKELGYPIRDLTGVYDEDTESAVNLFAQSYGIQNQTVAYIALQKELYSDEAIPYATGVQSSAHQLAGYALGRGNAGTKVMQIQNRLIQLGYMDGEASGMYDAETEAAVRAFESACGVAIRGQLNTELQNLLMSGDAPEYGSTYAAEIRTFVDLTEGSQGDQVAALQDRLIKLGYAAGTSNGIYGAETATAMRLFQQYNGLEPTGRAMIEDQTALFSLSALSYQDISNGLSYIDPNDVQPINNQGYSGATPNFETGLATLKIGSTGLEVSALQQRLNKLGYPCASDGVYDESTAEAVQAFQANVGVSQTGEASGALQQYLQTNAAPARKYRMYNSTQAFVTLRLGDQGEDVTRLQKQLWELGYLLTDDVKDSVGTFHDKTFDAVINAQHAMGYTEPNGVATEEFQCFVFSEYNHFIKR